MAIVTILEYIRDSTVLGEICGKNFLKDLGIDNTLIGDGGGNNSFCNHW